MAGEAPGVAAGTARGACAARDPPLRYPVVNNSSFIQDVRFRIALEL